MATKKATVTIANTEIVIPEGIYEVTPKLDRSAPNGMVKEGTTKFLHIGNKEVRAVPYDESRRAFDTGFYAQSACNIDIPENKLKEYLADYNAIRRKYEAAFNVDCSETNLEFWDTYRYEIYTNKTFDTSDPKDAFDLFHALKQGKLCNKDEKDPTLQKANYNITNKQAVKTQAEERAKVKSDAIVTLNYLATKKQDKLTDIIEYMGLGSTKGSEIEVVLPMITQQILNEQVGYDFSKKFIETSTLYDTKTGLEKIKFFNELQKLLAKGKIERKAGAIYHEGELLGNNIREVTEKIIKDVTEDGFRNRMESLIEKYNK